MFCFIAYSYVLFCLTLTLTLNKEVVEVNLFFFSAFILCACISIDFDICEFYAKRPKHTKQTTTTTATASSRKSTSIEPKFLFLFFFPFVYAQHSLRMMYKKLAEKDLLQFSWIHMIFCYVLNYVVLFLWTHEHFSFFVVLLSLPALIEKTYWKIRARKLSNCDLNLFKIAPNKAWNKNVFLKWKINMKIEKKRNIDALEVRILMFRNKAK